MKDAKKKSKVTKLLTTASLNDVVQINKWWEKPPEEDNDKSEDEEETKNGNIWNIMVYYSQRNMNHII